MTERNALAELAKRMETILPYIGVDCTVCEVDRHLTSKRAKDLIITANRIVSELAKVAPLITMLKQNDKYMSYLCNEQDKITGSVLRCRVIAEEGRRE